MSTVFTKSDDFKLFWVNHDCIAMLIRCDSTKICSWQLIFVIYLKCYICLYKNRTDLQVFNARVPELFEDYPLNDASNFASGLKVKNEVKKCYCLRVSNNYLVKSLVHFESVLERIYRL